MTSREGENRRLLRDTATYRHGFAGDARSPIGSFRAGNQHRHAKSI